MWSLLGVGIPKGRASFRKSTKKIVHQAGARSALNIRAMAIEEGLPS